VTIGGLSSRLRAVPNTPTLLATVCAFGILAALTRRPLTTLGLVSYLLGAVLVSSAVMQSYLGMPLTLADVQFFFRDPLDDLQLFLNYPALGVSFVAIITGLGLLLLLGWRFEGPRWPTRPSAVAHGARAAVVATLVGVLAVGYSAAPPMAHTGAADDRDAWSAFLALRRIELAGNWVGRLNMFFENRDMLARIPPALRQTRFPEAGAAPAPGAPVARLPDVLMVLEESTFDPQLIARCRDAACASPMFRAPRAAVRTLQGPLLVHTTGGGTWLTEFAFLSGFDWRTFGRGGAYAPVSLAPRLRHSLPQYLRSLGYHTVVFSAVGADFLRARSAYRYYGFDEFYASQDLQLANDWHAVRDATLFNKALAILGAQHDTRPLFVFMLTIRNHGPHGDTSGRLPASVRAVETHLGRPMADYLARLEDSAHDIDALRSTWLAAPQPRVIGWFGDHQPEFAWDFINTLADINGAHLASNVGATRLRYLTWQQLSANFGAPGVSNRHEALDVPFLGSELLDFAGVPLDADAQAALSVARDCHQLLLDCADHALVNDYLSYRIHDLQAVR
jgi:phosphoglycerol transferase MdoB-like AlkP superfamily enzyme